MSVAPGNNGRASERDKRDNSVAELALQSGALTPIGTPRPSSILLPQVVTTTGSVSSPSVPKPSVQKRSVSSPVLPVSVSSPAPSPVLRPMLSSDVVVLQRKD
jgi:hypothetical protein